MSTLDTALWYATRGTGVVALILFTVVVLLGILTRSGRTVPGLSGFVTAGLHRNASLVAASFLIIHIVTSILDPFAGIKWISAVVPFTSTYRPLWLGLGTVAFDLMLAIIITSLLRNRIGRRVWRSIHWFVYAMWPLAVVHSLGTGSDATQWWMLALVALCVAVVVLAAIWRLLVVSEKPVAVRSIAVAGVLIAPMALTAWAMIGPLAPHWAKRAGTPTTVLASSAAQKAQAAAKSANKKTTSTSNANVTVPSGNVNVTGTVHTLQQSSGLMAVVLDGTMSNGMSGQFRIVLRGQPAQGGGISLQDGMIYVAPSTGGLWQGSVNGLNGGTITGTVTGPKKTVSVVANVTLDTAGKNFQGQVTFN